MIQIKSVKNLETLNLCKKTFINVNICHLGHFPIEEGLFYADFAE